MKSIFSVMCAMLLGLFVIPTLSAYAETTWSSDPQQCDVETIDYGSDSRPTFIEAPLVDVKSWQKFTIKGYESSCEVDLKYIDPNGGFVTGLGTCYAEGDEMLIDIRVEIVGSKELFVDFRNHMNDFTAHLCGR